MRNHTSDAPSSSSDDPRLKVMVNWCFQSRTTHRITIAQFPNLSMGIFLAATVLGWALPSHGTLQRVVEAISTAALGWWAVDELVRGVNPWRRLLGAIGVGFVIARVVAWW